MLASIKMKTKIVWVTDANFIAMTNELTVTHSRVGDALVLDVE